MTKKNHISKKELRKLVAAELLKGRGKNEIRDELTERFFDSEELTKTIAATPHPSIKEKVKYLNITLGSLALLQVIYRFLIFGIEYFGSGLTILTLVSGIMVFRYDAMSYRMVAALTTITFLRFFMNTNFEAGYAILIDLGLSLIILRLGFHLGGLLFPNYGILGPDKDSEGNIILEELPTT